MTARLPLLLLCTAAALPALAQQKLLPAQSEIAFTSRQMGVPVDGKFRRFDAQIAFDPAKPAAAKVAFTVDTGSATLGIPETDAELVKPDWFSTKAFPQATFVSTAVKPVGANRYDVQGKLVIKGASHDLTVPVTLSKAGDVTTASGAFSLKRLDYKIGDGDWKDTSMVADDVQVKFKLALSGVPAP